MARQPILSVSFCTLLMLGSLACAGGSGGAGRGWRNQRPQLYPNAQYHEMGPERAQQEVSDCMARADYGARQDSVAKDAAINTLGGAAAGAALGAIGGAIAGDAGTGAAAGAAVGGTIGVGKTVVDSSKPQEGYKGYVEACLRERGYDVTDWR
jgi:hypothetical protein